MADMTPEEIQQARARAGGIVRLQDQCCANEEFLARAVLALTEQVEKLDDEALKWTETAGRHAEEVEALTEQQPEPATEVELANVIREQCELLVNGDYVINPRMAATTLLCLFDVTRKPEEG